jgi:hypothetical protein
LQIHANRLGDTIGARILSWRPLVYIGLLSYSFYLWHWPVLSLAHYYLAGPPPLAVSLALVALAFALAALSYRFVERPFRNGAKDRRSQVRPLLVGAGAIAVAVGVGLTLRMANGLPWRMPAETMRLQAYNDDFNKAEVNCDLTSPTASTVRPSCRFGRPSSKIEVLLWGDSHAEALASGVHAAATHNGQSGAQFTFEACAPLIGVKEVGGDVGFGSSCADFNRRVLAFIAAHPELKTVVIASRWALRTETTRFGQEPGERRYLVERDGDPLDVTTSRRAFVAGLHNLVVGIRQVGGPDLRILLVGQAPEMGFDAPQCLARAKYFGRSIGECGGIPAQVGHKRVAFARAVLEREAAQHPNIRFLALDDQICGRVRCDAVRGGKPLYRDFQHMSDTASETFAPALRPLLR